MMPQMSDSTLTGPRRLDPHIKLKILPASLGRYQKAVANFTDFIVTHHFSFDHAEELDDLIVEWKNSKTISKSDMEACVSGVEMALPQFKGKLPWSHAVLSAWGVLHQPKHTVPATEGTCALLGAQMASLQHPKLGAAVILQHALGLRPSEVLSLEREDILLPESRGAASAPTVVALGVRSGTKAKRAQTVTLSSGKKAALLRWLTLSAGPGEKLVPYTYENYRRILSKATASLGITALGLTPHSPRSGFATDCVQAGLGFSRTRELGRWVSEASLRTYLDVAGAAGIQVTLQTKHLSSAVDYACSHMLSFFPGSSDHLLARDCRPLALPYATDAAQRHAQELRGPVDAEGRVPSAVDGWQRVDVSSIDDRDQGQEQHAEAVSGTGAHRGRGGRGRGREDPTLHPSSQWPSRSRGRGRR